MILSELRREITLESCRKKEKGTIKEQKEKTNKDISIYVKKEMPREDSPKRFHPTVYLHMFVVGVVEKQGFGDWERKVGPKWNHGR